MKPHTPQETLIFVHIPKAAGGSVRRIAERYYHGKPQYMFTRLNQYSPKVFVETVSEADRAKLRYVSGHTFYGVHRFINNPASYITFFRNPLDYLISHYHFFGRDKAEKSLAGFKQFIQNPKNHSLQLDRIVGYDEHPNADGEWECAQNHALPTSNKLEIAEHHLRTHFAAIGLVEHFDESLILLRQRLGWRNIYYTREHYNVRRPRSQEETDAYHALIREYAAPDLQLYALAQQIYDEQKRAYQGDLAADLHTYQRNNRWMSPIYRASLDIRRTPLYASIRKRFKRG